MHLKVRLAEEANKKVPSPVTSTGAINLVQMTVVSGPRGASSFKGIPFSFRTFFCYGLYVTCDD